MALLSHILIQKFIYGYRQTFSLDLLHILIMKTLYGLGLGCLHWIRFIYGSKSHIWFRTWTSYIEFASYMNQENHI